jgi:hypothetical protein
MPVLSHNGDVTGGISGANGINPLVAFYDIHGRKKEVLFFYFVPDTIRDNRNNTGTKFLIHHPSGLIW